MSIKTKLLNEDEEILARKLRIKCPRGVIETPTYSVNVTEIKGELITDNDLQGMVEIPLLFKPKQLEKMSSKIEFQQQFEYRMNSYLRRIPTDQLIIVLPIIEGNRDLTISAKDAVKYGEYIAELISNPRIDVICLPLFNRFKEQLMKHVIEGFLNTMTSYKINIILSVPYASRDTREEIIEIYMKLINKNNRMLLNFVCADYNGSNPISKYTFHNYVLRYAKVLQDEINEPVIIYGANVKYSRMAKKYDELPARDLAAYYTQIDAFGGNHKRRTIPVEIIEKNKQEDHVRKEKILNRNRYTYISIFKILENPSQLDPGIKKMEELLGKAKKSQYAEKLIKQFNAKNILSETKVLRQLFGGKGYSIYDKPIEYLKSKEIVRIDPILLKRIMKLAKAYRSTYSLKPSMRTLDEFLE